MLKELTKKWLQYVKDNFSEIAQQIFEETYLKPYDESLENDLYSDPIERPFHGALHASRVVVFLRILVNFFKQLGYPKEIISLSEEEVILLTLTALFHDAGRQGDKKDYWEKESATLFRNFLLKNGMDDEEALRFGDYIPHSLIDVKSKLLESSDALDVMRVRSYFHLEKIPIFSFLHSQDQEKFIELCSEVAKFISFQGDLAHSCVFRLRGKPLSFGLPQHYDLNLKKSYEHHRLCYQKVVTSLSQFSQLNQFYNNNQALPINEAPKLQTQIRLPNAIKRKLFAIFSACELKIPYGENQYYLFVKSESDFNFLYFVFKNHIKIMTTGYGEAMDGFYLTITNKHWELLRELIRNDAEKWRPRTDFFIKSVQANNFDKFIRTILPPYWHNPTIRPNKKMVFTVTGKGVFIRKKPFLDGETSVSYKQKIPQYSEEEKKDFSQLQSVSLGFNNFSPTIFSHSRERRKIAGVILNTVLLGDRLFIYDPKGTNKRPYDFNYYLSATHYFDKKRGKNQLFSSDELDKFKQILMDPINRNELNEILVRARWSQGDFVIVGSDSLEGRLIGQEYVNCLSEELTSKGFIKIGDRIPIYFYFPETPSLHFRKYTSLEQKMDCLEAEALVANSFLREKKMGPDYSYPELLLGLSPPKLLNLFQESVCDHSFLVKIIADEKNFYIFRSFLTKLCPYVVKKSRTREYSRLMMNLLYFCLVSKSFSLADFVLITADFYNLPVHLNPHLNPLFLAIEKGLNLWVEKLLKNPTYPVNLKNLKGKFALYLAAEQNNEIAAALLLKREDLNLNAQSRQGNTALHASLKFEDPKVALLLIDDERINLNLRNRENELPLHLASLLQTDEAFIKIHHRSRLAELKESEAKCSLAH